MAVAWEATQVMLQAGSEGSNLQLPAPSVHVFKASDYVRHLYPIKTHDPVAEAFGRAFDDAVTFYSYLREKASRTGGLLYKCQRHFVASFNSQTSGTHLTKEQKNEIFSKAWRMFASFSKSDVEGRKPKTVFVRLAGAVYMACQPDLYDYGSVYELKSYALTDPLQPHIQLQVRLFGLAYPDDELFAVGFAQDEKGFIRIQVLPVDRFEKPPIQDLIEFGRNHSSVVSEDDVKLGSTESTTPRTSLLVASETRVVMGTGRSGRFAHPASSGMEACG